MEANTERRSSFDETCRFIDALVQALQLYGVSSRAMVVSLTRVVKALGLQGEFLATPDHVQTVLWDGDEHQPRVRLAVLRSGNYNLGKLARVTKLTALVEAGSIRPKEGLERLREIVLARDGYGPLLTALAFVLCGAAFAVIIGASWMDAFSGGLVGLISYGVTLVAARSVAVAALQEVLAAMMAALVACVVALVLPGTNTMAVTVAAVIVFVPGFGLTIAPIELMVGNTLSGIVWLTNALVAALKLFGGTVIGLALAQSAGVNVAFAAPAGHKAAWMWSAVPVLVIALAILMKADWHDLWGIALGGWLVYGALRLGDSLGPWQGRFLGSTALLIYAHWHARRFRLPSAVIILPCVVTLLPGFATLRALHTADAEGVLAGFQAGYEVLVGIVAIIGGSFVGDVLALHNLAKTSQAVGSLIGRRATADQEDLLKSAGTQGSKRTVEGGARNNPALRESGQGLRHGQGEQDDWERHGQVNP